MTEEIKEMLHCIEMNCKHNKCFGGIKLDEEDCKLLLDYITNLQQEKEYLEHIINNLKDNNNRLEEIIHDTDIVLEQENERLKEKLENKLTPEELVNMLNQELVRQNKCYKSRCEKTIEYIDEHTLFVNGGIIKSILNGSAENE